MRDSKQENGPTGRRTITTEAMCLTIDVNHWSMSGHRSFPSARLFTNQTGEKAMYHPLTRIFAPIFMLVLVAAFTVVTATIDTTNRLPFSVAAIPTVVAEAG